MEGGKRLFDMPPEIFIDKIWKMLAVHDLLNMRLTCKTGQFLVNDYFSLSKNRKLIPELTVGDGDDKNMEDLIQMPFISNKLYIDNSATGGHYFIKWSDALEEFFQNFNGAVTEVRINTMSRTLSDGEIIFLQKLEHLESLQIENFISSNNSMMTDLEVESRSATFIEILCNLKNIDIGLDDIWKTTSLVQKNNDTTTELIKKVFEKSTKLESIALATTPFDNYMDQAVNYVRSKQMPYDEENPHTLILCYMLDAMVCALQRQLPDERTPVPGLKTINLKNLHYIDYNKTEMTGALYLIQLATICFDRNIQLEMVPAGLLGSIRALRLQNKDFGDSIRSMINTHPAIYDNFQMNNLEHLRITTSRSCVSNIIHDPVARSIELTDGLMPEWPQLKIIELTVDFPRLSAEVDAVLRGEDNLLLFQHPYAPVSEMFRFLFQSRPLLNLTTLKISFTMDLAEMDWTLKNRDIDNIIRNCPSLLTLHLVNWNGTNRGFARLLNGIRQLEELIIENCTKIGNVGFVGEDRDLPVLLQMNNLRKLSLLDLDKMPKITNTLFQLILSRTNIPELRLTSGTNITNVTAAGLCFLRNGVFATTMKKISFNGRKCTGLDDEDFNNLCAELTSMNI